MQLIERDVLVDPNESGDYWYIPVTFYDTDGESIESMSGYDITVEASTVTLSNNVEEYHTLSTTGWALSSDDYFYALKVPKVTTSYQFTQYIRIRILLEDTNTLDTVSIVILNIRKAPVSSGSGGSSGSSSSISVPTAAEVASAVWNYGAEEGDETITDRTLSSTVDVNPSEIAQAVWNYSVVNPEQGVVGTRTLTMAIPTASSIADEVLTKNVAQTEVTPNGYTLTHLIMASQRSIVEQVGNKHLWKILPGTGIASDAVPIATRELFLNEHGAIVQTETAVIETTEEEGE